MSLPHHHVFEKERMAGRAVQLQPPAVCQGIFHRRPSPGLDPRDRSGCVQFADAVRTPHILVDKGKPFDEGQLRPHEELLRLDVVRIAIFIRPRLDGQAIVAAHVAPLQFKVADLSHWHDLVQVEAGAPEVDPLTEGGAIRQEIRRALVVEDREA